MGQMTLNPKIGKRYSMITEQHVLVIEDSQKLFEKSELCMVEYNTFFRNLRNKGIELLTEPLIKDVIIPEQGLDAELMKKLLAIEEVANRFMVSARKGGESVKKLMQFGEDCIRTKDRINIQQLKDQHALKLMDNLEKEALKTQADYWECKKNYETAFAEFEELKKGFDEFLK